MDLVVGNGNMASWGGRPFRCAVGRGGITPANEKCEGDGATPAGEWPMRRVFYRADRLEKPKTLLPAREILRSDGWCDDQNDLNYNRLVSHPYPASAERLWQEDRVYDLIVELGYNDSPVVLGKGSAIFLHIARSGYVPTAGCVALAAEDLLEVLRGADKASRVIIENGLC